MQFKRELWLDFIKIIACCLVVALHTVRADSGFANFVIVSMAETAIPLFLMVNGYLMFRKDTITYAYVGKKILRILVVCFSWEALHAGVYLLYYHEVRNFVKSFLFDFLQQGLFFHFWFMGTLIILYLLLPLLYRLYERNALVYIGILVGLGVLCAAISLVMTITSNQFVLKVPQSLRLWYWLFYYMLGGLLAKRKTQIQTWTSHRSKNVKMAAPILTILLLIGWQWLIGNVAMGHYVLETFYGSVPVMLSVTILFMCISGMRLKTGKAITYLSGLSMGVYVIHPFVLAMFQKFVPAFVSGNAATNLLFWIVTVTVCCVITAVINAIPVIKELIRL